MYRYCSYSWFNSFSIWTINFYTMLNQTWRQLKIQEISIRLHNINPNLKYYEEILPEKPSQAILPGTWQTSCQEKISYWNYTDKKTVEEADIRRRYGSTPGKTQWDPLDRTAFDSWLLCLVFIKIIYFDFILFLLKCIKQIIKNNIKQKFIHPPYTTAPKG